MEKRKLGRTDIMVSAVCLGTMTWGQQNTEAEGHQQMDYASENGVNFFDTAETYSIPPKPETQGATERIIGAWFKARKNRDKIILASKVAGRSQHHWLRANGQTRLDKANMTFALENSLKRLGTDYLDLYQLHYPDRGVPWGAAPTQFKLADYPLHQDETPILETLDVLDGLVKAGKIRHYGLSNESAWGTMRFIFGSETKGYPRPQSIQNAYNLINRTFETAGCEVWLREQVGLLAYSPTAQGYLSGKYLDGNRPAGARTTLFGRGQRYEKPGTDDAIRDYVHLAKEFGLDPSVMANAWVISRPWTTANIIGATTMEQLKLAIGSASAKISPELEAKIDLIHQHRGSPAP